ncbi:hypothetical protein RQP46_004524 [Phenoliferia psychrophenolica]
MAPFVSSAYGLYTDYPPFSPIGPGWAFDDWWFRGASTRASPPADGQVSHLPAGGTLQLEIACHIAFSTLGGNPSNNVACPNNNGAYHSGDPSAAIDYSLLSGCALAIADVTDISQVTVDNLAVFSVQKECVWQRNTVFNVPAAMPPCTGAYCICAWLWEPQNGTGNFYQTPFRCDVTGSPVGATPIQTPLINPTYCGDGSACAIGAKRPVYFFNNDYSNVQWMGNYLRPGYHSSWSFNDGAQNDIFMTAAQAANYHPTPATLAPAPAQTTYPLSTDLALNAVASASSSASTQPASAAVDGVFGGYYNTNGKNTGNASAEWSSSSQGVGAWLTLTWTMPVSISQVVVYDRINLDDHCKAFTLTFGDGSVQSFGNMNNDGSATAVTVPTVSTSTLKWTCTAVSAFTGNVGLSEIQVYSALRPGDIELRPFVIDQPCVFLQHHCIICSGFFECFFHPPDLHSAHVGRDQLLLNEQCCPYNHLGNPKRRGPQQHCYQRQSVELPVVVYYLNPGFFKQIEYRPGYDLLLLEYLDQTVSVVEHLNQTGRVLVSFIPVTTSICIAGGRVCVPATTTSTVTATACPTSSSSSSSPSTTPTPQANIAVVVNAKAGAAVKAPILKTPVINVKANAVVANIKANAAVKVGRSDSRLTSKAKRDQQLAREAAVRRSLLWTKKVHDMGDI